MIKTVEIIEGINCFVPVHWTIERDNNIVSIFDAENGVGALQISIYDARSTLSVDLVEALIEFIEERHRKVQVKLYNDYAFTNFKSRDGLYWQYWLLRKDRKIIFVSYNCLEEDQDHEHKQITQIVKSLHEDS